MSGVPYNPETALVKVEDMVRVLVKYPKLLGAFVINNQGIMGVGEGFTGLMSAARVFTDDEYFDYAAMPGCGASWHPTKQVGWIKTVSPRADVLLLPYSLMVDDDGYTSFDYKSTVKLPGCVPCTTPALYKELLSRDADCVYMTAKGPVFRKGEIL